MQRLKRGFGPNREKEYFVVQKDGDTWSSIIAGPFESYEQADGAKEALKPLYFYILGVVGGHLVGWADRFTF